MFVEITRRNYEKMKRMLEEMGVKFVVTDCTLPKDREKMVHIEINGLTPENIKQINETFGRDTIEVDYDGNGIPDRLDELSGEEIREVRRRKSDQQYSGPIRSAVGYLSGKDQEEEVIIDRG